VATPNARGVALAALRRWRTSARLADEIVSRGLDESSLTGSDRAFATDLFYGVLRNRTLLDFWIGCLREGKIDHDLRDLLQLGLYQLLVARITPHAAVNETVALARLKYRGIGNAILRTASRNDVDLLSRAKTHPLSVRTSHPEFLIERWTRNFGGETAAELCAWNNEPPPLYGRINRLKTSLEQFRASCPSAEPIDGVDNFIKLERFPHEEFARGDCYLQDPSTRLACELLNVSPGQRVLDACAAPGGKTAYLAELMNNRGTIVACDRSAERLELVEQNSVRLGVSIVQTLQHDWLESAPGQSISSPEVFDAILVDVPCTNTGVMRRRVDLRWRLQPNDFDKMAADQSSIVSRVLPLLKPGGALVYSTCSLEPEENQMVIDRLTTAGANLEETQESLPWRSGFDGAFVTRLRKP
jgi:16S rRNA (cytosine967-C5)-methyltransferase